MEPCDPLTNEHDERELYLPHGWDVGHSKKYPGKVYYFNKFTKASTWKMPKLIKKSDLCKSIRKDAHSTVNSTSKGDCNDSISSAGFSSNASGRRPTSLEDGAKNRSKPFYACDELGVPLWGKPVHPVKRGQDASSSRSSDVPVKKKRNVSEIDVFDVDADSFFDGIDCSSEISDTVGKSRLPPAAGEHSKWKDSFKVSGLHETSELFHKQPGTAKKGASSQKGVFTKALPPLDEPKSHHSGIRFKLPAKKSSHTLNNSLNTSSSGNKLTDNVTPSSPRCKHPLERDSMNNAHSYTTQNSDQKLLRGSHQRTKRTSTSQSEIDHSRLYSQSSVETVSKFADDRFLCNVNAKSTSSGRSMNSSTDRKVPEDGFDMASVQTPTDNPDGELAESIIFDPKEVLEPEKISFIENWMSTAEQESVAEQEDRGEISVLEQPDASLYRVVVDTAAGMEICVSEMDEDQPSTGTRNQSQTDLEIMDEEVPMDVDVDDVLQALQDIREVREILGEKPHEVVGELTSKVIREDSSWNNSVAKALFIVLDTNVLMHHLTFIDELKDHSFEGVGRPTLVIPWVVMQELDMLKDGKSRRAMKTTGTYAVAKRSVDYLYNCFVNRNPRIIGQTPYESSQMYSSMPIECNDDRILQCCLQWKEKYPDSEVLLFTNDRNLNNKAMVTGIFSCSRQSINDALKTLDPNFRGVDKSNANKSVRSGPQKKPECVCKPIVSTRLQSDVKQADDILCQVKKLLREPLSEVLRIEMLKAYGPNLWKEIVFRKPPWTFLDVIECFHKHWIAVFRMVLPRNLQERVENMVTQFKPGKTFGVNLRQCCSILEDIIDLCQALIVETGHNFLRQPSESVTELRQECKDAMDQVKTLDLDRSSQSSGSSPIDNNNQSRKANDNLANLPLKRSTNSFSKAPLMHKPRHTVNKNFTPSARSGSYPQSRPVSSAAIGACPDRLRSPAAHGYNGNVSSSSRNSPYPHTKPWASQNVKAHPSHHEMQRPVTKPPAQAAVKRIRRMPSKGEDWVKKETASNPVPVPTNPAKVKFQRVWSSLHVQIEQIKQVLSQTSNQQPINENVLLDICRALERINKQLKDIRTLYEKFLEVPEACIHKNTRVFLNLCNALNAFSPLTESQEADIPLTVPQLKDVYVDPQSRKLLENGYEQLLQFQTDINKCLSFIHGR